MIRAWFCAIALAAVVATPNAVRAQCGMGEMMGSGHDHGGKGAPGRTTKHDKSIQKILINKEARARLFEMIAEDEVLFREFLGRGFESARGRRIGTELLGQARLEAEPEGRTGSVPPDSASVVATYRCPMHPDVVSSSAGSCPKCGMRLERTDAPSDP
ncbi:MAG: heavy metal-binding domain-containing protein [Candidatus Eisenbacteria bacterium]